jgi:hypothetical protein
VNWTHENRDGIDVLSVTDLVGGAVTERFAGAVGWVLTRGTGPIVLDLTRLQGWSAEGERAVLDAVDRVRAHHRPLALCGAGRLPAVAVTADQVTVFPDLDAALESLKVPR